MTGPHILAGAIDRERLWQRHMAMAEIGATGRGGIDRQALGPADIEARRLFCGWARRRGFTLEVDAIGNLFVRRPGRGMPRPDAALAPAMAGSHLDSQPAGGNFDGVYGVLAGLEVLEALEDAGIDTLRPVDVAVWTNEEGSRFQPTTMGSAVHAGAMALETALDVRDGAGTTVREALAQTLAAMPEAGRRPLGAPVGAYVEAHIEQGPVLESEGRTIGVVSGIQGLRWFRVEVEGQPGHAGTVPMAARRDALSAAVAMVRALEASMRDPEDRVRFTVGRFETRPNSPNTIPGGVTFTIDFRHPDEDVLTRLGDRVAEICEAHAGACEVAVTQTMESRPTAFDRGVVDAVRSAADSLGLRHRDMVSGATHDAKWLAGMAPAGMIFVPCAGGVSHAEEEWADAEDLAAGARVLAEVLAGLADRPG